MTSVSTDTPLKVCALTMVRNDDFFLRRWVDYYSAALGRENLYIYFDGKDQAVPDFCAGCNVTVSERLQGGAETRSNKGRREVAMADKARINFLSEQAARLLERYDMAIGTDVDEFLAVDPALGLSLREFLALHRDRVTVSGLGVDVGENLTCEKPIDPSELLLTQRGYGYLSSRYTKASVITRPVRWGSGFHRVKGHNFHIAKGLYLFHFGSVDLGRIRERLGGSERTADGWTKHLLKRAGAIKIVSETPAVEWEAGVSRARTMQTCLRQLFAPNKPAMYGHKVVVKIPERFRKLV